MARESPADFLMDADGDRRDFFRTTVGKLVREVGRRAEARVVPERLLRPPGALSPIPFLAACTRCGDCIPPCPVGAIVKTPPTAGLAAGTPMIDPMIQACIACADMPCAAACPTEALAVPERGWDGYRMAVLELDTSRCISFYGSECGVCVRNCPVGEDALALDEGGRPVIKAERCVGCGSCVRVCVTNPSSLSLRY